MSKEEGFVGTTVGEVVMHPLGSVKPNPWNPNLMTKAQRRALELSLREGWLASNALTVWGTDDEGKIRNVIIDGEQRWAVAKSMGFEECPMVVLHGLAEARAKDLTIRLDGRGTFDDKKLAKMLVEQQKQPSLFSEEDVSVRYGIKPERVESLLILANAKKLNDPAKEWVGMPECESEDQTAFASVKVNFASESDREAFEALVGQTVPRGWPHSIWYPKAEIGRTSGKSYESTDAGS